MNVLMAPSRMDLVPEQDDFTYRPSINDNQKAWPAVTFMRSVATLGRDNWYARWKALVHAEDPQ